MLSIRKIIKEFIEDEFSWINNSEPTFKNFKFEFDGIHEYWVDLSMLSEEKIRVVFNYVKTIIPNNSEHTENGFSSTKWKGLVIHCGVDENDYKPEKNKICFLDYKFDDDEENQNSEYVEGEEVYQYILMLNNDSLLGESLNWSDKDTFSNSDTNWGTDNYYGPDVNNWTPDATKSQWVQGGGSSSSETSSGDNMSEEEDILDDKDEFKWIKDIEEHPNYNGLPQGVVYIRNHEEIDEFFNIIENLNNGKSAFKNSNGSYEDFHSALEWVRGIYGENTYEGDAIISLSFFVERPNQNKLISGYWDYAVDDGDIEDWLDSEPVYEKKYKMYKSLDQLKKLI